MLTIHNHSIAYLHEKGNSSHLFWLSGFRSDMQGGKAERVAALAKEQGYACTRFDYSGHGQSSGDFQKGTIGAWLEEAKAVYALSDDPKIIIGSSMGGWIGLLLAKVLQERGTPAKGLVLIAPAPDFTQKLMWEGFSHEIKQEIIEKGVYYEPSPYDPQGLPITRALIEEGKNHLLMGGLIEVGCPVHIIAGGKDESVPLSHVLELASLIQQDTLTMSIVQDGDHRLSREEDLELLCKAIIRMAS